MLGMSKLLDHVIGTYKQLRVFKPENGFLLPNIL